MSKLDKLKEKLNDPSKDLKYSELRKLLKGLGYVESNKGKTSGSRVAFYNVELKHIIRIHKPHPANELKRYAKEYVRKELVKLNLI